MLFQIYEINRYPVLSSFTTMFAIKTNDSIIGKLKMKNLAMTTNTNVEAVNV